MFFLCSPMVHRTYYGLGGRDNAVSRFDELRPHARDLFLMQGECEPFGPGYLAMGVAIDGLCTAAYHFTRRPHFYMDLDGLRRGGAGNGRLRDRAEAIKAFEALQPYAHRLVLLRGSCRPFGADYMALEIARLYLETAAFHFTGIAHFYGAKGDSSGPVGPPRR